MPLPRLSGTPGLMTQIEVPLETVRWAVGISTAEEIRALVNMAPPFKIPRTLLEKLDPLVVNEHEASFLLGIRARGKRSTLRCPGASALGPRSAVITFGAASSVVANHDSAVHLPAPEADMIDTTGAGDAFVGALAVKLARHAPLREAAAYAVRAGAATVTKEGAQDSLPTPEVVETL